MLPSLLLFREPSAKILEGRAGLGRGNTHVRQARPQALALRRPLHERHEKLHGLEHAEGFARGAEGFLRREERAGLARGREHRRVLKQRDELILAVRLGQQALELVRVRQRDVHLAFFGARRCVYRTGRPRARVCREPKSANTLRRRADCCARVFASRPRAPRENERVCQLAVRDSSFPRRFNERRFFPSVCVSVSSGPITRGVRLRTLWAVLDRSGVVGLASSARASPREPVGASDRTARPHLATVPVVRGTRFRRTSASTAHRRAAQRAVSTQRRTRWGFPKLCASPRAG